MQLNEVEPQEEHNSVYVEMEWFRPTNYYNFKAFF